MKRRFAIERERRTGAIDGLNLFFGALLGANLGTLGGLKLVNYMQMIAILAAMVIALRVLSASAKRGRIVLLLLGYAAGLVVLLITPALHPEGLRPQDLKRLIATMGIWIALALVIELAPTNARDGESEGEGPAEV